MVALADLPRLHQALGDPALAWLVERVRRRLAAGGALSGTATLRAPTSAQREALDRLLGRRPTRGGGALTVRLDDLDAVVAHAGLAGGLAEAVQALGGPVLDERARQAAAARAWDQVWDDAGARVGADPALGAWLDRLRADGLVRRLAGGDPADGARLLDQAVAVAACLPAAGMPLAELAAQATGDSHALDAGAPVGTLAVRAAAAVGGVGAWDGARGRRDAWAAVGVLCDELSAPVLTLNLPTAATARAATAGARTPSASIGATDRALAVHAEAGEPYRLSVRQLLRDPPALTTTAVFVCENPTVVAAAANRLGAASAPLVCVEGHVRTAARLLLGRLAAAGAPLAYHGDFDWAGLRIATTVIAGHGAQPWRLTAADYRAAPPGPPLRGTPADAAWDPDLAPAMRRRGHGVHEEQVLDTLLHDLAT
ncbi:MAG: TIGR02679 family protein [Egibacteraceae bacterium]